jgi:hypothetical protein
VPKIQCSYQRSQRLTVGGENICPDVEFRAKRFSDLSFVRNIFFLA